MLDLSGVSVIWITVQWGGSLGVFSTIEDGERTSEVYFFSSADQYALRASSSSLSSVDGIDVPDALRRRRSAAEGNPSVATTGHCKSSALTSANLCGIASNISRWSVIADDASIATKSETCVKTLERYLPKRRAAKRGASALALPSDDCSARIIASDTDASRTWATPPLRDVNARSAQNNFSASTSAPKISRVAGASEGSLFPDIPIGRAIAVSRRQHNGDMARRLYVLDSVSELKNMSERNCS